MTLAPERAPAEATDTGRSPSWPVWAPPRAAVGAWSALQGALVLVGWRVPCQAEPEAWWAKAHPPVEAERQGAAVEACGWCPVVGLCRDYALTAREAEGVWGGTSPADRRRLQTESA